MILLTGEFIFGDMCIFLWVCMREKEREANYSSILGEAGHRFIRLWGSYRVRTHLSGPLTSQASSFPLWIPEALDWPQGTQISFILSPNTPQQLQSWKASLIPPFATYMLLARPLRSGPQFPHMSHELIRVTALWGCCRFKPVISWKWLEQSVNIKVCTFFLSSCSQRNESWTAHGQRSCKSTPQATLWVS